MKGIKKKYRGKKAQWEHYNQRDEADFNFRTNGIYDWQIYVPWNLTIIFFDGNFLQGCIL